MDRAKDDQTPISIETFEKELDTALKKAGLKIELHVVDLMSQHAPLVLASRDRPVTAKQATEVFEALHQHMCRYHATLGQIASMLILL